MLCVKLPDACPPILAAHLLRPLEDRLLELLRSLAAGEWQNETIVPGWQVRDVVAHLLDTQLRKLSIVRDGHAPQTPAIRNSADLVAFINGLNAEGVRYFRRFSPPVLVSLMETASHEACAFHESLDPFAPALFAVSWAGERESLNWFDTARELTERWHHQQQIRLATSRPGIEIPEFYHSVLDCFLRGLPHTYREVSAPECTSVRIDITGDCGGTWHLYRHSGGWMLTLDNPGVAAACITIPQSVAWKLFTKGLGRDQARTLIGINGDQALGEVVLRHLAIVG
jgi:uncharacterized protein (TIGR03083 family)